MDGDVLAAVAALPPVAALRASRYAYPIVNIVHVAGLAVLYGAAVAMDLAVLGAVRRLPARSFVRALRPLAIAGLVVAAASGTLLFAVRAPEYAAMPVVWAKLAFVGLATLNAALFVALAESGEGPFAGPARLAAALSLALWTAAIAAGRLIGYEG